MRAQNLRSGRQLSHPVPEEKYTTLKIMKEKIDESKKEMTRDIASPPTYQPPLPNP